MKQEIIFYMLSLICVVIALLSTIYHFGTTTTIFIILSLICTLFAKVVKIERELRKRVR